MQRRPESPLNENAPGNVEDFIKEIISATKGKHKDWLLNPAAETSRFYSKSELYKIFKLNGGNYSTSYIKSLFENLLGLGILEAQQNNEFYGGILKRLEGYRINIKRLKQFDKPPKQPE